MDALIAAFEIYKTTYLLCIYFNNKCSFLFLYLNYCSTFLCPCHRSVARCIMFTGCFYRMLLTRFIGGLVERTSKISRSVTVQMFSCSSKPSAPPFWWIRRQHRCVSRLHRSVVSSEHLLYHIGSAWWTCHNNNSNKRATDFRENVWVLIRVPTLPGKSLKKIIHFSRTQKVLENRIWPWKFWNLM